MGPPGVGKGTQATTLSRQLSILHISCGDLLRNAVKENSELGQKAKGFMQKGELVPDELVGELIVERIKRPDAEKGFILDGYPRNIKQAQWLGKILKDNQVEIDVVVNLNANEEIIIQRLSGRRLCSDCGANFHVKNMPSKQEGICDKCGGKLYQRADDNEETIKNRLKVYQDSTFSLIDYYKNQNKLQQIDANEEAGIVAERILRLLNDYHKVTSRN